MEKRTKQVLLATGASVAILAVAIATTGPDSEKAFKVTGTVAEASDESISLTGIDVLSGNDDVTAAFAAGEETMYDEYRDGNCTRHETTDDLDALLGSGQLSVGSTVTITGNLGSSQYNCLVEGYSKNTWPDTNHIVMTDIQPDTSAG